MNKLSLTADSHGWGSDECIAVTKAVNAALYSLGQAMAGNQQLGWGRDQQLVSLTTAATPFLRC